MKKNLKNVMLSCIYRPLRGDQNIFTGTIKDLLKDVSKTKDHLS